MLKLLNQTPAAFSESIQQDNANDFYCTAFIVMFPQANYKLCYIPISSSCVVESRNPQIHKVEIHQYATFGVMNVTFVFFLSERREHCISSSLKKTETERYHYFLI